VKVVMGFLELAAVVKFLRTAELVWKGAGRPDVLRPEHGPVTSPSASPAASTCSACTDCRTTHEAPESIGVPRLMFRAWRSFGPGAVPAAVAVQGATAASRSGPGGNRVRLGRFVSSCPNPSRRTNPPASRSGGQSVTWEHNLKGRAGEGAARGKKLVFPRLQRAPAAHQLQAERAEGIPACRKCSRRSANTCC